MPLLLRQWRRRYKRAMRFHLLTLGCRLNRTEGEALRQAWLRAGHEESAAAQAEVVVVNSCAVTAKTVAQLRQAVRQTARSNPGARIVLTGCAAGLVEGLADLPGVVRLVAQGAKQALLTGPLADPGPAPSPAGPFAAFDLRDSRRMRPAVKIQDGCTQGCAYCVVPLARGPAVSRAPQEVVAAVEQLFQAGFAEVVLSGVNLRQYGHGLAPGWDLWRLVALLEERLAPGWTGRARLRLSSLDPSQCGPQALAALTRGGLLAPHLHLSLQSLSTAVLRAMGRSHTSPQAVVAFCQELTKALPICGLGADLLVGFPGETPDQFAETAAAMAALPLTYAHVFPYSRRPGTRAAQLPGQVAGPEKKARAARLRAVAAQQQAAFCQRLLALPQLQAVFERDSPRAMSQYYVPLRLGHGRAGPRGLVAVRPVGLAGDELLAEVVP